MAALPAPVEAAADLLIGQGGDIDRELAEQLVLTGDDQLPPLIVLAHEVRLRWMGPAVEVESLISATTSGSSFSCGHMSSAVAGGALRSRARRASPPRPSWGPRTAPSASRRRYT